jgi:hypothetical protein
MTARKVILLRSGIPVLLKRRKRKKTVLSIVLMSSLIMKYRSFMEMELNHRQWI